MSATRVAHKIMITHDALELGSRRVPIRRSTAKRLGYLLGDTVSPDMLGKLLGVLISPDESTADLVEEIADRDRDALFEAGRSLAELRIRSGPDDADVVTLLEQLVERARAVPPREAAEEIVHWRNRPEFAEYRGPLPARTAVVPPAEARASARRLVSRFAHQLSDESDVDSLPDD